MLAMKRNSLFCRLAGLIAGFLLCFLSAGRYAQAIEIRDIRSPKGVNVWIVEDHTVPVITIQFSFRGGSVQDPAGKGGLVNLICGLLGEGAGELRSGAFLARLDGIGARIGFSATDDAVDGSMQVLAENRDQAVDLLVSAVQKPRFDQDAIDRIREQFVVGLRASERDPSTIAEKKFAAMVYGRHPYSRWRGGTPESLAKITRADLVSAHRKLFARDNVKIGIVGPVSPKEAGSIVDRIFSALPQKAELQKIEQARLYLGGMTTVHYDMPQTSIMLVYPGVRRDDPGFYAAYLMNHILGGAGFTSRLFKEIREKRGLAYSVDSRLKNSDYASSLSILTGTRAESAQETLETIRNEIRRMVTGGVTAEELAAAKSYVIGAYAVYNMGSSSQIAAVLVSLQQQNLPVDYLEKRSSLINAVTLDEVNAVARKLLSVESAILMVGPMKD